MADNEFPFSNWFSTVEGNIATEPKLISGQGKNSCVVFRLAIQNRSDQHGDHSFFIDVKVFSAMADNMLASYSKGHRVVLHGKMETHEYEGDDKITLVVDMGGGSNRWNTVTLDKPEGNSGSSRKRRSDDDDDEDEKPSRGRGRGRGRSRDEDEEEDDRPSRSRRRSDDDEDEDDRPSRGRGRGRSRDDDDDDDDRPARGRGRGRSRDDDDEEEDERPSRSRRSRSRDDD